MGLFDLFKSKKPSSAELAKERLKIIVEHSRADAKRPDYLNKMRLEILEVVSKYVDIELNDINTNIAQQGDSEVLELNIVLPDEKINAQVEKPTQQPQKNQQHAKRNAK